MLGLSKSERLRAHVAHAKLRLTSSELSFVLVTIRRGTFNQRGPRTPIETKAQLIAELEHIAKIGHVAFGDVPHEFYDRQLAAQCRAIIDKLKNLPEEETFGELAQRVMRARIGLQPIELHYVLNLITHGLPRSGQRQPKNLDQLIALVELIIKDPAKAWGWKGKTNPEDAKHVADNWTKTLACLQRLKDH